MFALLLQIVLPAALAEGAPALSAETEILKIRFGGFAYAGEFEAEISYSDGFFLQDAEEYHHDLAQLSIGMAIASFRGAFDDLPDVNTYITEFFDQAGFTGISMHDYDKAPSPYTMSSCIARKEIAAEGGNFTLVAVALCGANYGDEWASNLTVGNGERHEGFANAAELVENRVLGYLVREGLLDKKVKIWISGFSRAGAVAGITGADLTEMGIVPASDLFVYTFASPHLDTGVLGVYAALSRDADRPAPGLQPHPGVGEFQNAGVVFHQQAAASHHGGPRAESRRVLHPLQRGQAAATAPTGLDVFFRPRAP